MAASERNDASARAVRICEWVEWKEPSSSAILAMARARDDWHGNKELAKRQDLCVPCYQLRKNFEF
jgi:hypothetical protein